MREVLEVVIGILVVFGVVTGVGTGLAFRQAHRANRVSPLEPSDAPLRWLVSLGRPAQLHRRLRRATAMVVAATQPFEAAGRRQRRRGTTGVLDGAGRELVRRAVALDTRLVACDRGGALWRRRQLPDLEREVATLERSSARLAALSIDLRKHLGELRGSPSPDEDVELGLDALEAAIGELRHGAAGNLSDEAPPHLAG
jgi:hypothetical protein